MVRVVLIGEFNTVTENLYDSMMRSFQVQFVPETTEVLEPLIRLVSPDVIVVSTVGIQDFQKNILHLLDEKYSNIPAICIGTEEECSKYRELFEKEQFTQMFRPVKLSDVTALIWKRSGKYPNGTGTEEEIKEIMQEKKTILLIDDSAIQLRMMRELLKKDYIIKVASSAEEARRLININVPDMIFLDYDMPKCDGKMFFEELKEEMGLEVPVVFLTGIKDKQRSQEVIKMQPAGYIIKPVDKQKIMDIVQEVLHGEDN